MKFFDLHCDTPWECYKRNLGLTAEDLSVNTEKSFLFQQWVQTFAIWVKDDVENPWQRYCNILSDFKTKITKIPNNLKPVLAVEGGAVLENKKERVEILQNDGIKFLTLTWNGENLIAGGSNTDKGLTDYGKEVIKELNRFSIGCDLSHINEKSFYKAIEIADFPLATHSNCYSLKPHPRNLKDEQIKLIAEKNGIIGLCFYPEFLGEGVFESIYKNIYHICDLGFENNIAIGSDFDGANMHPCLDRTAKVPQLYEYLQDKNLSESFLDKVFYKNAENFLAKL